MSVGDTPADTSAGILWEVVPSVDRVAFVGRLDGRAVGVVEWDGYGYRAVTCSGVIIGRFGNVDRAERALSDRIGA